MAERAASRPFLDYWKHIEALEMKRRQNLIPDDRHYMTLALIEQIGADKFLEEAEQVTAIQDVARYYGRELTDRDDLEWLMNELRNNTIHSEVFYYAFYFAAWIREEVPSGHCIFASESTQIKMRISEGGSL